MMSNIRQKIDIHDIIRELEKHGNIPMNYNLHIGFHDNNFECPDMIICGPKTVEMMIDNICKRAAEIDAVVDRHNEELRTLIRRQNKEEEKWPALFS